MGATIIENDEQEKPDLDRLDDELEHEQESTQEDEIPDKYRGKSVADIVKMHQEAEKALGKQGQELGELRRTADEYIRRTLAGNNPQPNTPAKEDEGEVDFFVDPQKAVEKIIERDPRIKDAKQAAEMMRRENAQRNLLTKHPDALELAQSEDFQAWVAASKVRTMLFAKADQDYDFEAAEELISTFKDIRGAKQTKVDPVKPDPKAGKMMPRATSSGSDEGTPTSKKIYRRADLIKLQQVDPARYLAMQDEIMEAYREKRVR